MFLLVIALTSDIVDENAGDFIVKQESMLES